MAITDTEQRRQESLAAIAAYCLSCGTDTRYRECRDWCPQLRGACTCGQPLCGQCMRADYY